MTDIYHQHPKDDRRLCFYRRLYVYICGGGGGDTPSGQPEGGVPYPADRGYPISGSDGGIPTQVQTGVGYPILGLNGGTPSQVQMEGTPSQVQTGGTLGYPPPGLDGVNPPPPPNWETEQHSEPWPRGGRYASCVHAGGLSGFKFIYHMEK